MSANIALLERGLGRGSAPAPSGVAATAVARALPVAAYRASPPHKPLHGFLRSSCAPEALSLLFLAADAAAVFVSAEAVVHYIPSLTYFWSGQSFPFTRLLLLAAALLTVLAQVLGGAYRVRHATDRALSLARPLCAIAGAVAACAALAIAAAPHQPAPLAPLAAYGTIAAILMLAPRLLLSPWLRAVLHAATTRRAVIYGDARSAARFLARLRSRRGNLDILGVVSDDAPARALLGPGVAWLGSPSCLREVARRDAIDMVIVVLPPDRRGRIAEIVDRFRDLPLEIHLADDVPDAGRVGECCPRSPTIPVLGMPLSGWPALGKRIFDLVAASVLLVLLLPVLLLTAVAIMIESPGGALFRQERVGFRDARFRIWKFRSMHAAAPTPGASSVIRQATRSDARITRVGAIIRRTSIDELPQLINVLRGEMSLVGPRPHAPNTLVAGVPFEQVVSGYAARHRIRPGMTGLAQMRGWRGETDTERKIQERVRSDLEYIRGWSFALDVRILLRTIVAVVTMRNAY